MIIGSLYHQYYICQSYQLQIWIKFKIDGQILSKNSFLAGFLQIRDGASAGWYLSL